MMRDLLLIFLCSILLSSISAQAYTDDFETYEVGTYIGPQSSAFTTWSGTTGGAEDAKIVDTQAKSGTKSIYFFTTDEGPQDVILDFGQKYTTGTFNLKFAVFVAENSSAYWNFQQEITPGTTWAGNAFYRNNQMLTVDAGSEVINAPFFDNEWNTVEYDIDLDNNEWIIRINDICVGTLLAPASVSSLDIYPILGNATTSEFWIDDLSFEYSESTVTKTLDVALVNVATTSPAFVGSMANIGATIVNTGTETVNNFEIELTIQGGSPIVESFTDVSLEAGASLDIEIPEALNASQGLNIIEMGVLSTNGLSADDVPCNNNVVTAATGIKLADDKVVVVEEATGTWCTWCVRGHVFMEYMEDTYTDRFIGIAVHNNDPMMVDEYDTYVTDFPGFSGFPNALVDRSQVIDPSGLEVPFVERVQEEVNVTFEIEGTYEADINELVTTVTVHAKNDLPLTRRLVVVLVEDEVTGTAAGYNQINAYAGGANGPMGGYENLPSPVPAAQMVYQDVARALFTPADGIALGEKIDAGSSMDFTFGIELSEEFDQENLRIVAFLASPAPVRQIDNAYEVHFTEAITTGTNEYDVDIAVDVFPNPTNAITNFALDLGNSSHVEIQLFSMTGQLIRSRDYGKLSGEQIFTVDAGNLSEGVYSAVISIDGNKVNKKIVVSH